MIKETHWPWINIQDTWKKHTPLEKTEKQDNSEKVQIVVTKSYILLTRTLTFNFANLLGRIEHTDTLLMEL